MRQKNLEFIVPHLKILSFNTNTLLHQLTLSLLLHHPIECAGAQELFFSENGVQPLQWR